MRTAIPIHVLLTTCLLASAGHAQDDRAELIKKRDAKLDSAFLRNASWTTDYDAALQKSERTGLPVLIYFTRSYAPSAPCETLEQQVLSAGGFKAIESRVVLYCNVTSRVETDPHQDLFERLGGETFPFIAIVDEAGRPVAQLEGIPSLASIQELLDGEVRRFVSLRERAAKGEPAAKGEFLMLRLKLGHVSPGEVRKIMKSARYLTPGQRAKIRGVLASMEVIEILGRVDDKDPKSMQRVTDHLVEMKSDGRIPAGRMAFPFWQILIAHANVTEDADLFAEALDKVKELSGTRIDKAWLTKMENRLKLLRFMQGRKKDGK